MAAPKEDWPEGYAEANKGPEILIVTITMTVLALLFVAARIYSRQISMRKLAVDDYIVIFCILLSIIYVAISAVAISHGGGRHLDTLSPADASTATYLTLVAFVPGVMSFILPKFAVLILLAKILNPGRVHRWLMWGISVTYFLLAVGMLVINFAQCSPAATQWGAAKGTCWDRMITVAYALALGVTSAIFDFYLAIYPSCILWRMQMNWKKKLALSSSLGFGYCAGAITIYKCTTLPGLLHLKDFTYSVDDVVLWTNIEANCVLIGACIPTFYPLVKKIFGSSALGGSTPNKANSGPPGSDPIVTIGSSGKRKRKKGMSLFELDTTDGTESRDAMITSFHSGKM